jgi:hypothetical protein
MSNSNHPWRQHTARTPTIDQVAGTRSSRFAAYLATLSRDERKLIETAERAFIAKTNLATSHQQTATRDHARGMLGVKENEPTHYRGFVA